MFDKILQDICYEKAHQLYGSKLPAFVKERLKKELDLIIAGGYAEFFVAFGELVRKSTKEGYRVVPRGCVGALLAAMLCGITETNPLKPHYRCPHCFYTDFDSDEVKAHAGGTGVDMPDKNCPVCGTPLDKAGFDIPYETFLGFEGDKRPYFELNIPEEYMEKALENIETIFGSNRIYCEKNEAFWYRVFVLPPGETALYFDENSLEENALHTSFVGHKYLTMLRMLEKSTGFKADKIRLDDPSVMKLFEGTDVLGITPEDIGHPLGTLGIPEFGTAYVMQMILDAKPKCFSDLVRISGLSHGTEVWKDNEEKLIRDGIITLSECISTRDDIMNYLIRKGLAPSMAYGIMESVRKGRVACGREKKWPEWEKSMKVCGVPDWFLQVCKKIQYLFPKAHTAAYMIMAYRIAFYKVYYPLEYYAAYFSTHASSYDYAKICQDRQHLQEEIEWIQCRLFGEEQPSRDEELLNNIYCTLEMYARGYKWDMSNCFRPDICQ